MDFDTVGKVGSRMGTGTMIILDDKTCPVGMVHNLMQFFAQESCGWCTPCRDGLPWVSKLLDTLEAGKGTRADIDLLHQHVALSGPSGRSYCDLNTGALTPLRSGLERFGDIFTAHLQGFCPVGRA